MARKKKKCSACGDVLIAETNFNKDKRNIDGYRYECKLCHYKSMRKSLGLKITKMEQRRKK